MVGEQSEVTKGTQISPKVTCKCFFLSSTHSIDVVLKMMMTCTTYANWECKKLLSLLKVTKLGLNYHSLATMNLHKEKKHG